MATTLTSTGITFNDSSTFTTKAASSTYRGDAYGLRYTFDSTVRTATGANDGPAKGHFALNSATLANVTRLYVNMFNANGTEISGFTNDWASASNGWDDGGDIIIFTNNSTAGLFLYLTVAKGDGSNTIGSGDSQYQHFTVSHVTSSTTLNGSSGEFGNECVIQYVKKGAINTGPQGATGPQNPQRGPEGSSSDARLKQNVRLIPDAINRLKTLNPVRFDWIESGVTSEGFLAQEILEIDNQLGSDIVIGDPDSNEMLSVNYGKITPLLTAALQESLIKIDELEKRIETLEKSG